MSKSEMLISKLELLTHPEGGYYRETYRSEGEIILENPFNGRRNYSTCIYFLLTSDTFSAFHKIQQDEIWHFYDGSPLNLHIITPEGNYSCVLIGKEILEGQIPQFVVKSGCWFAASVLNESDFSLVGCTVSPGFDFRDFELANKNELILQFCEHSEIISKLTR